MNTHPQVSLRTLGPQDSGSMRAMLGVFAAAFEDPRSYLSNQPSDDYLRRLLQDGGFVAIAVFDDNEVVGGLAGYVLRKFEQPRSECYIYDLAVHPVYQRRGLATLMIEHLKAECRDRGVSVIYVQADYGDEAAVALYTKLGIRENVMHFDIEP